MILNSVSRNHILKKAMQHAYAKRERDRDNEYDRLAKAIYEALFSKKVQDAIALLPNCWYVTGHSHRLNVGGQTREWKFNGTGEHGGPRTGELRLPAETWTSIGVLTQDKHAALIERISEYDKTANDLKSEMTKTEATLRSLLASVRTLEALGTVWPEGKKLYHDVSVAVPTPPGLPMIAMVDLNRALGLANQHTA